MERTKKRKSSGVAFLSSSIFTFSFFSADRLQRSFSSPLIPFSLSLSRIAQVTQNCARSSRKWSGLLLNFSASPSSLVSSSVGRMNSGSVVEELPKIAPLKIKPAGDTSSENSPPVIVEDEEGCITPKSEANLLKPSSICPPAPKKLRQTKRKKPSSPRSFFPVPRDLSSVFFPVSYRPKKRIRAG